MDPLTPIAALARNIQAMTRLLVDTGDMTPQGRRQVDRVVTDHLARAIQTQAAERAENGRGNAQDVMRGNYPATRAKYAR